MAEGVECVWADRELDPQVIAFRQWRDEIRRSVQAAPPPRAFNAFDC